jgi:putative membrane-bound dehydrogenase-like protein
MCKYIIDILTLAEILGLVLLLSSCQNNPDNNSVYPDSSKRHISPVPAVDALSTFELEPGFKIDLIAAEPLISDPVDMEIDEFGRLYVVEMHGYPLDKTGTGVIKLLSDSDGDGLMDKSIVFADGLTLPNSIMRWKKGVIITDAPNLVYLEDTNGDGKSDIRDTMLTGFALSNPQHNLNSPLLGLDNWIYLAHEGTVTTETYQEEFGDEGTEIYYPSRPAKPRLAKNASGRSVRFKPDEFLLEETSSKTQFGHAFDSWGHHLLVSNANHIIQEVIPATYLKRNPGLVIADATESLSDHGQAAEVFPITKNPQHQLLTDIGVITSACGIISYQGGAFPSTFENTCFVAEPVSNLIHIDKLKDTGTTFVAGRMRSNKEFLASTDSWFRPVNMYTGPDGALYVVDYYRQIIEHPEWMGDEVIKSGELYNGHDRGRIYRIAPVKSKGPDWTRSVQLGNASSEELVQQLSNPNSWWRLNAQRLLIDRKDKRIVPELVKLVKSSDSPLGRLHALWTLEGLHEMTPEVVKIALNDPVPGVRKNAIQIAELHLSSPGLSKVLLTMQDDPDPKVRFQLLCTLGFINTPEVLPVRNKLLFKDINDKWVQVAALSGSSFQTASLLDVVLDSFRKEMPAYASLVQRLTAMIAQNKNREKIHQLIVTGITTTGSPWQVPLLEGLAQGLKSQKGYIASRDEQDILTRTFFEAPVPALRNASLSLLKVMVLPDKVSIKQAVQKALSIAVSRTEPEEKRVQAIYLMGLQNPAPYKEQLKKLIVPSEPSSIQVASLRTLSIMDDSSISGYLIEQWTHLTPNVQDEALNTFLTDTIRIGLLLDALEKGKVQAASVGWPRSVRLMAQSNLRLRAKARKLLAQSDEERIAVNKQYQQALTLDGNIEVGKKVYMKNCSSCHQVKGTSGINFGPDLGSVHNWSRDAIMINILAPSSSISSGYDLWHVELKNGESFQGIISSETPTALTLKNAAMEIKTINRADIVSLKAMNISAMPTGLEKQINQQQMADLLAFLKEAK